MKYMKRSKIYQASNYNCTFDPTKVEAHSYKWWRFVAVVDGVVLFNNYRYSVSTAKHQRKVAGLMRELGIQVDVTLQLPRGIRNDQTLAELYVEAEETLCEQFLESEAKRDERNAKARQRSAEKRAKELAEFKANVETITYDNVLELRAAKEVQGE